MEKFRNLKSCPPFLAVLACLIREHLTDLISSAFEFNINCGKEGISLAKQGEEQVFSKCTGFIYLFI